MGQGWGCRRTDAGREETRWSAGVSQAPVAGGGRPELKAGAAKAGGQRLRPAARQPEHTHFSHPETLCGPDGV